MRTADAPSELLQRIGQRIHDHRRERGESRAVLAARAGLSVRFLAQVLCLTAVAVLKLAGELKNQDRRRGGRKTG